MNKKILSNFFVMLLLSHVFRFSDGGSLDKDINRECDPSQLEELRTNDGIETCPRMTIGLDPTEHLREFMFSIEMEEKKILYSSEEANKYNDLNNLELDEETLSFIKKIPSYQNNFGFYKILATGGLRSRDRRAIDYLYGILEIEDTHGKLVEMDKFGPFWHKKMSMKHFWKKIDGIPGYQRTYGRTMYTYKFFIPSIDKSEEPWAGRLAKQSTQQTFPYRLQFRVHCSDNTKNIHCDRTTTFNENPLRMLPNNRETLKGSLKDIKFRLIPKAKEGYLQFIYSANNYDELEKLVKRNNDQVEAIVIIYEGNPRQNSNNKIRPVLLKFTQLLGYSQLKLRSEKDFNFSLLEVDSEQFYDQIIFLMQENDFYYGWIPTSKTALKIAFTFCTPNRQDLLSYTEETVPTFLPTDCLEYILGDVNLDLGA